MGYDNQPGNEKVLKKIKYYCAYQERCHAEVKEKLYAYGLHKADVELLLSQLVEENYLNEERFAIAFAGGRFRIKKWGRTKIKYELKQKQVSEYCIKKALRQIDESDYIGGLNKLVKEKYASLKNDHPITRKKKTIAYLQQKGYEYELILRCIENNYK